MPLVTVVTTSLAAFLGATGWSLAEYWIHRELGHNPKKLKNPFGTEHVAHHGKGNYFASAWKKAGAAALATALLLPPAVFLAGALHGGAFVAGFVGFYLTYELIHRLEHVFEGVGAYGRWARQHHFWHHFHNPRMNHGVTTPVWDHVFGTYEKPGRVEVPRKMAMPWLCDASGEVHPHLQELYGLRGASAKKAA